MASQLEAGSKFRCPVCRAGQPLQNECRRCQADLTLVVLAHQRVGYLLKLLNRTAKLSVSQQELIHDELALLSPRSLPT